MRTLREKMRRRDDDGFTIAEMMVAILVFALMSIGSIYATMSMLKITNDARSRQVAANLAAQEIDAVRAVTDIMSVTDSSFPVTENGTTFHVQRTSSWTSGTGTADNACGATATGANLRYKEVTVRVTWDGMRSQTAPVMSNTLLNPRNPVVDDTLSTIMVTVLGADGTGRAGVSVTATGASSVSALTDNQGCAYLLKVTPGSYTIRVSKPGFVDDKQQATSAASTTVAMGASAAVQFQYDQAATYSFRLASGYVVPPGVTLRTFASPPLILTPATTLPTPPASAVMTQTLSLHPFASGYSAFVGSCTAADPVAWGAPALTSVGTAPGGSVDVPVPMGVVLVTLSGPAQELKALPVSNPAVSGDPGCANVPAGTSYTFGSTAGLTVTGQVAVALPYGSWQLTWGGAAVSAAQMAPTGQPAHTTITAGSNIVTFDPRVP